MLIPVRPEFEDTRAHDHDSYGDLYRSPQGSPTLRSCQWKDEGIVGDAEVSAGQMSRASSNRVPLVKRQMTPSMISPTKICGYL